MNTPTRKRNRLREYDYSQQGAYFITACAKNRAELFGHIVGATCGRPSPDGLPPDICSSEIRPLVGLSDVGQVVKNAIETLSTVYPMVHVGEFVIMPNHVHMIIVIGSDDGADDGRSQCGRPQVAPTVSRIIQQWKGVITKQIGFSPWQKSFHDHMIRSEDDYLRIVEYVENNPERWELDSLHPAKLGGTP